MSYVGAVNIIKTVAEAVNPDGFFQHGTRWDASLSFGEADQQIYLYPILGNIDLGNHWYESWKILIDFCFQDAPDSSPTQRQQLIQNADILMRLFMATIDGIEAIDVSNVQVEPFYRQNAGTYSGMKLRFDLGTTTDLCEITVDDIIIPPAQTLCAAIRACVGNVEGIEVSGNGTTTVTIDETIGKDILFVSTDGRIRKQSDYSHNATTGAFTFVSAIQTAQKIFVLYK